VESNVSKDRLGFFWGTYAKKPNFGEGGYCKAEHFSRSLISSREMLILFVFSLIENKCDACFGNTICINDFPIIDLNIRRYSALKKRFKDGEFEKYLKNNLKIEIVDTMEYNKSLSKSFDRTFFGEFIKFCKE